MSDISKKLEKLTPAQRELLLKKLQQKNKDNVARKIEPREDKSVYPMSAGQKRLWFLQQMDAGSGFYNLPLAIRIVGKPDKQAFEQAINAVVQKHDILRACYVTNKSGQPEQHIAENAHVALETVSVSASGAGEIAQEKNKLLRRLSSQSISLEQAPLLRAHLIEIKPDEHVFLLNMHHIISDGWSVGVMVQEIILNYKAATGHGSFENSAPRLQFADYADWLDKNEDKAKLDKQLQFWKDYLSGMPVLLELPTDRPRPAIPHFRGKHVVFDISSATTKRLREISRESNISLFMLMLAAFQTFLYRISGQKDFGLGAPVANRNRPELQEMVGFLVNTVTVRSRFEAPVTFLELARRAKDELLEATSNQDIPFERIVEALVPERDLSHSPLFQVMFDLQKPPFEHFKLDGLSLHLEDLPIDVAKFDLMLLGSELENNIRCNLEYSSDIFDDQTAQNFAHYFEHMLNELASNPSATVQECSLIDDRQREQVLDKLARTATDYPGGTPVHKLFEHIAAANPDKTALRENGKTLTYGQLNESANRLAQYLRKRGAEPEKMVALFAGKSIETVIAILGILKSGSAYLPLDTSYPSERIAFMLDDCDTDLIISVRSLKQNLPESAANVFLLDEDRPLLEKESADNPDIDVDGDNLAYVMYTSGSTGTPKGVSVRHKSIVRLVKNSNFARLDERQVFLLLAPVSFDASTLELWGSLLNGAKLVILPVAKPSFAQIAETIEKENISVLWLTAGLFHYMVEEYPDALARVKQLLAGGDVLSPEHVKKMLALDGGQTLINGYGPTENTTFTCCHPMEKDAAVNHTVPIGKPIANTSVFILDENFSVCPEGVPGELFIGGDGLARGYLNRPSLTAERFIPNPHGPRGSRMYSTGDLVKLNTEGVIEFLGRLDTQVKIRGFRIEPGEIESTLKQHPSISDAVVIVREDKPGDKQLVAYLIADGDKEHFEQLSAWLAEKMPSYMVPSHFSYLEAFPLTANGKVDRRALPRINKEEVKSKKGFVSPRNALESYLAETWREVLDVKKISMYDNFFDLGGNSLKAAVLINRLQDDVEKQLHVGMVFQAPRIAEFSMYAQEYFSDAVLKKLGQKFSDDEKSFTYAKEISAEERISEADIRKFRHIIEPLSGRSIPAKHKEKNKPALFVLSPPRSGSTLLRVMLAGHPKLFSPPELDLLGFNSMRERHNFFVSKNLPLWLEATVRTIKEIEECTTEEAQQRVRELEERDISVKDFYHLLQDSLGERLLVDKTPSYPLDMATLQRAEEDFDNPLYIHLVRHPYAMIYSFIEARLDKNFFKYAHSFTRQQLAELIWLVSNENINTFLENIPQERKLQLRFEDLLQQPEKEIRRVTKLLDIPFTEEMLKPYQGQRMTDGLKDTSQMVGDFKFYLHNSINTQVAERWRRYHKKDFLCEQSCEMARYFGYRAVDMGSKQEAAEAQKIEPVARQTYMPLSFAQQRLWFIDQLEPGNTQYNVPGAVRISGPVDAGLLEKSINLLIGRHEILRTSFHTVEGEARQRISSSLTFRQEYYDYGDTGTEKALQKAQDLVATMSRTHFRLDTLPLFRIALIRIDQNDHILVLVAHHIITDGWSNTIFIRELTRIYEALKKDKASDFEAATVQYADIAQWQRRWIESDAAANQLSFWEKELQKAPPLLEIPTDRPRRAGMPSEGRRFYFEIPQELTEKIRAYCNRNGVTAFSALMSAFQILMHHYARQDDVLIGTPVAGRTKKEMEGLIGLFVNTIVVRTQFEEQDSFRSIVDRTSEKMSALLENQDYPFEKILDALNVERSLEHSPLFQVMFSMQGDDMREFGQTFKVRPYRTDSGSAKFDLLLELYDTDAFRGAFEYNTTLFRDESIERLYRHFLRLLEMVSAEPDKQVDALQLPSEEEQQQILAEWNDTQTDYPAGKLVPEIISEQAAKAAQHSALVFEDTRLSYAEFDKAANRLAHFLISKGLQPEQRVAVCMDRSIELVIALHGIMRAAGVYVPLDPQHPQERSDFMLEDSAARLVICEEAYKQKFAASDIETISFKLEKNSFATMPDSYPDALRDPDQLAYMIYTSGSTGKPKGTLLPHRGFLNRLQWMQQAYPLGKEDVVLQKTPFSFDVSVWEFFWPFMYGATLVVAQPEGHKDTDYLCDIIREHKVTTMHFVPPMLKVFLENPRAGECSSLRDVICSGEALPYSLSRVFYETLPTARLHNLYGPTEASIDVSHYSCPQSREDEKLPIGRPIANTTLYILNDRLNPVPAGVAGELHIGGVQLARGYANRPALTAEKFIPDPFAGEKGARLYKTGDLCRYLSNGEIEYIGRIDHQVKVRGFRVELGEIESALARHPSVETPVVLVRALAGQENALCAYVVSNDKKTSQADLRAFLKKQLPDYMVPAIWIFIEKIPLTANGKVDRRALPDPESLGRDRLETKYIAPRNEKERVLAGVWQDILKLKKVGIKDNFFELGGDSIVGIQLISAAARQGLSFTPKELFEYPTIEGLAAVAREGVAIQAQQETLSGEVTLTPIMRWFNDLPLKQRDHWNQSLMLKSTTPLSPAILEKVALALYNHHDMLRLRWTKDGAEITEPGDGAIFKSHDLRKLAVADQPAALREKVAEAQRSHNLEQGNVFSMYYFLMDTSHGDRLFITVHHAAIDVVSWRVIMEDLQLAYTQLAEQKEIKLPAKTTSFPYWAQRLQRHAQENEWQEELAAWRELLGDNPAVFEADNPGTENIQKNVKKIELALEKDETAQLTGEVPETYNTSVQDNLLAALFAGWSETSGHNSLLIDMEGHGREALFEEVDLGRTVGWFTTLYPVNLTATRNDTGEMIKAIKEKMRAIPANGIGWGLMRYFAPQNIRDQISDLPAATLLFNYLGQFDQDEAQKRQFESRPDETEAETGPENRRAYNLEITAHILQGRLSFTFYYCPDVVNSERVTKLADSTISALREIIKHSLSEEAGGYTPSDFKEAGLDQEDLDDVLSELDDLE